MSPVTPASLQPPPQPDTTSIETDHTPRWRRARHTLVLLVCGAAPVAAFPTPNLEWVAWFALIPGLILLAQADTTMQAVSRSWWMGGGYLLASFYWLAPEIGPGVLLIGLVGGATWLPYGVAAHALLQRPTTALRALTALVVVPACWLPSEWLRSWQALGGPWAVYGASQWQHPTELALASVGGVWLISVALVMTNVALVLVLYTVWPTTREETTPHRRIAVLIGVPAILVGVGTGPLIFTLTPEFTDTGHMSVALVQSGHYTSNAVQDTATRSLTTAESHGGRLAGAHPDLIVWGESSETSELARDHPELRRIEALSAADGAQILVNQDSKDLEHGKRKVAMLIGPDGVHGSYTKARLVPFGEYIPLRHQLGWLTGISRAAPTNTVSGPGARILSVTDRTGRQIPIGVLICFESAFPDMSRIDTIHGARLLVYQSSTATFQGTWGPDQHAALAAVRAAETGRPAAQAALTGDSVAFDARGRTLAWLGQSGRGVLTVQVTLPPATALTPYDRFGDYVPWTAVAIAAVAMSILAAGALRPIRFPQYAPAQPAQLDAVE